MTEEKKRLKTIKGWTEWAELPENQNNGSWDKYCNPGELVDEGVYNYFLDILPPRTLAYGYLQVGEPHSHELNEETGKYQPTFATFVKVEKGVYLYCGNCFQGKTENIVGGVR